MQSTFASLAPSPDQFALQGRALLPSPEQLPPMANSNYGLQTALWLGLIFVVFVIMVVV
jgi:hypothetical protein